jgi:hypothetical protein
MDCPVEIIARIEGPDGEAQWASPTRCGQLLHLVITSDIDLDEFRADHVDEQKEYDTDVLVASSYVSNWEVRCEHGHVLALGIDDWSEDPRPFTWAQVPRQAR